MAELLGHVSMSSSQVYLHPDPARLPRCGGTGSRPKRAGQSVRALAQQMALRDSAAHPSILERTRAVGSAAAITALIDPNFLQEMGWDSERFLLFPPEGHRLLIRPVCVSEGCSATSAGPGRICGSCQRRLHDPSRSDDEIASLPSGRAPAARARPMFSQWLRPGVELCADWYLRATSRPTRDARVSRAEFLVHPLTVPFGDAGPCQVASCPRQRRHLDGRYCAAHQIRLRTASRDQGFDELDCPGFGETPAL